MNVKAAIMTLIAFVGGLYFLYIIFLKLRQWVGIEEVDENEKDGKLGCMTIIPLGMILVILYYAFVEMLK